MADGAGEGTAAVTTPTAPAEPAGGGAPATAPTSPAPATPGEGGSGQAASTTAPAPAGGKEPPQFPWSEHRKLKNQLERYERDLNERNERLKAVETERQTWQQSQQGLAQNEQVARQLHETQKANEFWEDWAADNPEVPGIRARKTFEDEVKKWCEIF